MTLHRLFRIFYTTFFIILNAALVVLLAITPGDAIHQALENKQLYNVFVIAGCYVVTVAFASFIYASRLLTNRAVLQSIPKTYIPVEKGDVNKNVRKMIVGSLGRSAAIAWGSRPRVPSEPATIVSEPEARDPVARTAESEIEEKEGNDMVQQAHGLVEKEEPAVTISPPKPVWGEITHNGWASPTSPDLPNLQYITVILELPHLIEARAVSLAPADPDSTSDPPLPDLRAVDLLQRPAAMGLRDYIGQLTDVGIITSASTTTEFLASYEYARFSARPLSEPEFRDLMRLFAEVLRSMNPLSADVLASLEIDPPESDIDDDGGSSTSTPVTERSRSIASSRKVGSRSSSEGTIRTAPSRRPGTNSSPSKSRRGFSTAPATPSKKRVISRTPSTNSFAQSRRPYNGSSGASSESLRSTSQGSVIKLSRTNEEGELPYTLTIPGAR
jgi:hypothetical protein